MRSDFFKYIRERFVFYFRVISESVFFNIVVEMHKYFDFRTLRICALKI